MKKTLLFLMVVVFAVGHRAGHAQTPRAEPESFIQILQQKLDEIKKIKESMNAKLAEKDAVIADLQGKAAAEQQQVPELTEQLDAAKSENQKLEGQLKNAVNEMEKALEEKDSALARLSESRQMSKEYQDLKAESERLNALIQALKAENQDLKTRASDYATQIAGLRDLAEKEKQELRTKLEKTEAGRRFLDMGLRKINESMDDILGVGGETK